MKVINTQLSLAVVAAIGLSASIAEVLDTSLYPYSCDITFSGYAGSSTLENFPALVRIPANSDVYRGSGDGSDLRFTDTAGNLVPHEINSWNYGGESLVWVRVPALSGTTTKLKLYFGAANNTQVTDPGEVWTAADYRGVWHFEGTHADSSTNHLSCSVSTSTGGGSQPSFTMSGCVGTCMKSVGTGYIVVDDSRATTFPEGLCTVSAWVKYDGTVGDGQTVRLLSCKREFSHAAGFEIHERTTKSTGVLGFNAISSGNSQKDVVTPDFSAEPVYLTVAFAGGKTTAYTNGALSVSYSSSTLVSTLTNLFIGAQAGGNSRWKGSIDELRLRWAAPSADWAAADYATQTASGFAVLGALERHGTVLLDEKDYSRKSTITLSGYSGATTLFNFPVLVHVPASSGLVADVPGGNLRFADADGYLIPHELDTWNADGSAYVWVRVPKLSGKTTKITAYGGVKTSAPAPLSTGSVWSTAGYKGVWHFSGTPDDSSANAFTGSKASGSSIVTNGVIGGSYYSDVDTSRITIANDARWANFPTNALTLSGWIRSDAMNCGRIISCKTSYNATLGFEFTMQNATNKLNAIGHDAGQHVVALGGDLNFKDAYVYATAVYADGYSLIYANGELVEKSSAGKYAVYPPTVSLTLGKQWVGNLDELRLQWAAQSADWVKADYDAQRSPDTFAVVGDVEDLDATVLDSNLYQRRAEVTFSGYAGASTLANFPALVRVSAGSPLYAGSKADGRDLRFTDLYNKVVPHEIEVWNKQGESLVWVRVPSLSGTATKLRVYFKPVRGAVVPTARSLRDVWGAAGYRGVWHFAGTAEDSSPNNLESVATGVTYAPFGPLGQAFQSSADGTGVGGYVSVDDLSWWRGFDGRALTVSAWVHCTSENNGYDRIVSAKAVDTDPAGFEVTKQSVNNRLNANGNRIKLSYGQHTVYIDPYNINTQTVYTTFVFGDGLYDVFVNGRRVGTPSAESALLTPTNKLFIGAMSSLNHKWHGQIDEVRLRWVASEEDWIKADFDTQDPAGAFTTIGAVERLRDEGVVIIFR